MTHNTGVLHKCFITNIIKTYQLCGCCVNCQQIIIKVKCLQGSFLIFVRISKSLRGVFENSD